jgi:tetratricopeptide (TPR) repeat protein
MRGELVRFPAGQESLSVKEGRTAAERALAVPISERAELARDLRLEHPEVLLALCETLARRIESAPASVSEEAEFFYRFLEKPVRKIGEFDERDYFLGELALLAGGANRILFRRDDARRWFDRAEAKFVRVANASVHFARLGYQRLALAMEERRFDEVLELAPAWSESSRKLGLFEETLKCRFLEGIACREMGNLPKAAEVFREIYDEAQLANELKLLAPAANNLAQLHRLQGDPERALDYARQALDLLKRADSQVGLVKLRWCVGDILREQGKTAEAIDAYREAVHDAEQVGMRGDAAAIHLVLADSLLQTGQEAQAEWEVRAALPIIDEEEMVPEGVAALSLLRESLRRRKIDGQALRNLHGYFRD